MLKYQIIEINSEEFSNSDLSPPKLGLENVDEPLLLEASVVVVDCSWLRFPLRYRFRPELLGDDSTLPLLLEDWSGVGVVFGPLRPNDPFI